MPRSAPLVAILAGGQSRRMGRDKALVSWRGRPLLAHMVATARAAGASEVVISGDPAKYAAFGPCVPDHWPGCGPLGGIASVLRSLAQRAAPSPAARRAPSGPAPPAAAFSAASRVLILACDLPEMTPRFLRWLWARSIAGGWTVPLTPPDRPEPLCAVYAAALLPILEAALAAGDYKITRALASAPQRRLRPDAIAAAGFAPDLFRNCNSPADLGA
jgi:molybdopterin-guanine dinucleotide biosynthesis protein A